LAYTVTLVIPEMESDTSGSVTLKSVIQNQHTYIHRKTDPFTVSVNHLVWATYTYMCRREETIQAERSGIINKHKSLTS
jgi:hypothetical protein